MTWLDIIGAWAGIALLLIVVGTIGWAARALLRRLGVYELCGAKFTGGYCARPRGHDGPHLS